jgi:hypothetical protein
MCDYYPEDATPTYLSILKYGKPTRTRRLEESSSTSGSGSGSDSDSDSENWSIGMDMDINININNDMSNEEKLLYNHERGQASTSGSTGRSTSGSTGRKLPYISPGSSSCFATFGGTSHTYFTPTFATLFIIVIGTITTMQLYLQ